MPAWIDGFPPVRHVVDYLTRYEERYQLPVLHGVKVSVVRHESSSSTGFVVDSSVGLCIPAG